jgi:DNA-binding NarL/FixJ family response regulator
MFRQEPEVGLEMRNDLPVLIVAGAGRQAESLRVMLRAMSGIEVVGQAGDLSAAWQLIKDCHPDMILVELNLTSKGTRTLLAQIAAEHPEIRFVALVDGDEQAQAARAAGVADVLAVPVTFGRLQTSMQRAMQGRQTTVS